LKAVEDGIDLDELEEKKKSKKQRKRRRMDGDDEKGFRLCLLEPMV